MTDHFESKPGPRPACNEMTAMLRSLPTLITQQPNNTTTDPSTKTPTQHYSIQSNRPIKHHSKSPQNKSAHLGITIRGSAAAAGGAPADGLASDLAIDLHKIIGRWFRWC